ncbi:unnamed protein product [Phytophthora lilii]|uniref:Unnamed protein product n=1 Tax=Phytophthora lilii TaxID=2077276 RepID=A0A9W6TGM2_9STRA|nr:unnamed protein product [Phytophthora lilii]
MLSSINEVMAPVATDMCGSVTLQRKTENGIMLNTSEKEIAYLDTKARVKHSAQQVAQLDKPEKEKWVAAQRLAGNNAFHRGENRNSSYSGSADVLRATQVVRGPTTLPSDEDKQFIDRLDKQLEDISRCELRHKHRLQQQKQFQKKMMQEAVGKLYKDKKEVESTLDSQDAPDDLQAYHKSFITFAEAAVSCNGWNAGVAWVLAMFAMFINAISRIIVASRTKVKMS